ncbi:MAG: sigma-54-dependent Fis family transcriptional regulator [Planctomycetaceae bacterium]|nr:sigma-54-dependent Fis family transcriptional regulator [Planctomycetaceae bacterium]
MTPLHTSTTVSRVLVVDDHASARESMADVLRHAGHAVQCCSSAVEALQQLERWSADVIVTDLKMPGMNGLEFLRALSERTIDAQIVMVTAHATVASAVDAMRLGAFDYIEKPFGADQLEQLVARALQHGEQARSCAAVPAPQAPPRGTCDQVTMIGTSPAMTTLRQRIQQVAPTDETVLITGESGTGKELVARNIHLASRRAQAALVSFNCPALSPQLMESELFGHERGAFTGADAPRVGRFELADRGTVLLDEITEIELPLQAKLLRVLQEQSFERVGSSVTQHVDVRVLVTTNRDLYTEVKAGRFRQDLYFRLAVVPIQVPPLRQRREDIPQLVEYFLDRAARRLEQPVPPVHPSALHMLVQHHWPGNVRELENIITRASVLCGENPVTAEQLRPWLLDAPPLLTEDDDSPAAREALIRVGTSLQDMERRLIEATLEHYQGHRAKTAQALGIGIRTLANKLRSYGYAPREKSFLRAA